MHRHVLPETWPIPPSSRRRFSSACADSPTDAADASSLVGPHHERIQLRSRTRQAFFPRIADDVAAGFRIGEFLALARREKMAIVDGDFRALSQVRQRENETQMPQRRGFEGVIDVALVRPFRRDGVAILEPAYGGVQYFRRIRTIQDVIPFVYFF